MREGFDVKGLQRMEFWRLRQESGSELVSLRRIPNTAAGSAGSLWRAKHFDWLDARHVSQGSRSRSFCHCLMVSIKTLMRELVLTATSCPSLSCLRLSFFGISNHWEHRRLDVLIIFKSQVTGWVSITLFFLCQFGALHGKSVINEAIKSH